MDGTSVEDRLEFVRTLMIVARRWRTRLDERLKVLGFSQARWAALYWISRAPEGLSQTVLAERAGVEPATLVRVVDMLQEQGLIERRVFPGDRRINLLVLTEAAYPIVAQIEVIADDLRRELTEDIDPEEVARTLEVLKRVNTRLDQLSPPAVALAAG